MRVNRLSEAFKHLFGSLLSDYCPADCQSDTSPVDSLPIITCSGKRANAVAKELTDKGFCSTKSMYYYGSKLHALAFRRPGHLPFPESLIIAPASENDLNVQKQYWIRIFNRTFYGDKIYNDEDFFKKMTETNNSTMMTPVKAVKNQSETIVQRIKLLMTYSQPQYQKSDNLLKLYSIGLLRKQIFKECLRCHLPKDSLSIYLAESQLLIYFLFLTLDSHKELIYDFFYCNRP